MAIVTPLSASALLFLVITRLASGQTSAVECEAMQQVRLQVPAKLSHPRDVDVLTYRDAVTSLLATKAPYLPSWNWKLQCVACSLQLFHALKNSGTTGLRIMNSNAYHVYLSTQKGIGTGDEVIVDPTYLQFLGVSEAAIKEQGEPSVFIGTRADLIKTFKRHETDFLSHYAKWRNGLAASDLKRGAPVDEVGKPLTVDQVVDFCYGFGPYKRTDATDNSGGPEALRHFNETD